MLNCPNMKSTAPVSTSKKNKLIKAKVSSALSSAEDTCGTSAISWCVVGMKFSSCGFMVLSSMAWSLYKTTKPSFNVLQILAHTPCMNVGDDNLEEIVSARRLLWAMNECMALGGMEKILTLIGKKETCLDKEGASVVGYKAVRQSFQ